MNYRENEQTELKRELTENIKKEVIAFANTHGGSIYIGIDDNGAIVGLNDLDKTMLDLGNMLRDSIHPDVMMFIEINTDRINGKDIIHIRVSEGTNKPYYIIQKGIKPSGVYVRQGSASVPASHEQIRQMIKATDGDIFEENLSLNQALTFDKTSSVFKKQGLLFESQHLLSLGCVNSNHIFTNLGLLLSDQFPFTIKAAVFNSEDQSEFVDRREFKGPLFSQLEECYSYLQLNNTISAEFQGLYRRDEKAYPDRAIREALLNSIIHRDYSYSASIFINIYQDRMEFTSIGGLIQGIQKEDILMGLSICRNKKLADIFYRLDLIEAYGTGLLKIQNAYKENYQKPQILTAPNSFKLILPRIKKSSAIREDTASYDSCIMEFLKKNKSITRKDVEQLLNVSSPTAVRILSSMVKNNTMTRIGRGKNTKYISV